MCDSWRTFAALSAASSAFCHTSIGRLFDPGVAADRFDRSSATIVVCFILSRAVNTRVNSVWSNPFVASPRDSSSALHSATIVLSLCIWHHPSASEDMYAPSCSCLGSRCLDAGRPHTGDSRSVRVCVRRNESLIDALVLDIEHVATANRLASFRPLRLSSRLNRFAKPRPFCQAGERSIVSYRNRIGVPVYLSRY